MASGRVPKVRRILRGFRPSIRSRSHAQTNRLNAIAFGRSSLLSRCSAFLSVSDSLPASSEEFQMTARHPVHRVSTHSRIGTAHLEILNPFRLDRITRTGYLHSAQAAAARPNYKILVKNPSVVCNAQPPSTRLARLQISALRDLPDQAVSANPRSRAVPQAISARSARTSHRLGMGDGYPVSESRQGSGSTRTTNRKVSIRTRRITCHSTAQSMPVALPPLDIRSFESGPRW